MLVTNPSRVLQIKDSYLTNILFLRLRDFFFTVITLGEQNGSVIFMEPFIIDYTSGNER